jgi:hypothetical protein
MRLPKEDAHKFVWDFYNWVNDPVFNRVSSLGWRLKRRRVHADYWDTYPGPAPDQMTRDIQMSLQDTDELLKVIPTLSNIRLQQWVASFKKTGRMS